MTGLQAISRASRPDADAAATRCRLAAARCRRSTDGAPCDRVVGRWSTPPRWRDRATTRTLTDRRSGALKANRGNTKTTAGIAAGGRSPRNPPGDLTSWSRSPTRPRPGDRPPGSMRGTRAVRRCDHRPGGPRRIVTPATQIRHRRNADGGSTTCVQAGGQPAGWAVTGCRPRAGSRPGSSRWTTALPRSTRRAVGCCSRRAPTGTR